MKTNVILIDDDNDTLDIFQDYLELKGVNVLATGKNGKDAVELYSKHNPDVVLLDVMMPDYDGFYGLANILKQNSNAKVIMVTADMTDKTKNRLKELNATGILYKPYEIDTVLETIDRIKNGERVLESNVSRKTEYMPLC